MTRAGPPSSGSAPVARCRLRLGDPGDARLVARWHVALIPDGFLSSLGERLLRRLYGRVVRSPGSFLVVAEGESAPVGFVAGSVALGRLYRDFALRDGVPALAGTAPQLVAHLPRALETLRHGRAQTGTEEESSGRCGELLAIAVDPAFQGRGVGRMLVDGFVHQLARRGVDRARVVVGAGNHAAIALYEQAGFRSEQTFELHRGTDSLLMTRLVHPDAPRATPGGA